MLHALDQQQAIELLLDKLRETQSNYEFLLQVQKTTPQSRWVPAAGLSSRRLSAVIAVRPARSGIGAACAVPRAPCDGAARR